MEGDGSTEPGVTYLSRYPGNYSNVSIHPVLHPCKIERYLSSRNAIKNHNRMRQYDLDIDKYWVSQSVCFILATTVALIIIIVDGKQIFYHVISERNTDKKI